MNCFASLPVGSIALDTDNPLTSTVKGGRHTLGLNETWHLALMRTQQFIMGSLLEPTSQYLGLQHSAITQKLTRPLITNMKTNNG